MKPFKYAAANSSDQASKLLGDGSVALAGGTNLLNLMKEHVVEPDVVVDIKTIAGLESIARTAVGFEIGANVTLDAILSDKELVKAHPALVQALAEAGTPQVRNRATIGGNLCCRPACWYFQQEGFDCAKNGGKGCAAKTGENEFHAIFDTVSPCVSVHASSAAPALLALGAKVTVSGPNGSRQLSLDEFFVRPTAETVTRENVLAPKEIVTHVMLGGASPNSATYEVRQKAASDWPISVASVDLKITGGVCRGARVFLGAVAPTPWRAKAAEAALVGQTVTDDVAVRAATASVEGAQPLSQNAYKVTATKTAVKRAILLAATGKWQ